MRWTFRNNKIEETGKILSVEIRHNSLEHAEQRNGILVEHFYFVLSYECLIQLLKYLFSFIAICIGGVGMPITNG
jgi:hypothetical protein